jgi:hypothetical protein
MIKKFISIRLRHIMIYILSFILFFYLLKNGNSDVLSANTANVLTSKSSIKSYLSNYDIQCILSDVDGTLLYYIVLFYCIIWLSRMIVMTMCIMIICCIFDYLLYSYQCVFFLKINNDQYIKYFFCLKN